MAGLHCEELGSSDMVQQYIRLQGGYVTHFTCLLLIGVVFVTVAGGVFEFFMTHIFLIFPQEGLIVYRRTF